MGFLEWFPRKSLKRFQTDTLEEFLEENLVKIFKQSLKECLEIAQEKWLCNSQDIRGRPAGTFQNQSPEGILQRIAAEISEIKDFF